MGWCSIPYSPAVMTQHLITSTITHDQPDCSCISGIGIIFVMSGWLAETHACTLRNFAHVKPFEKGRITTAPHNFRRLSVVTDVRPHFGRLSVELVADPYGDKFYCQFLSAYAEIIHIAPKRCSRKVSIDCVSYCPCKSMLIPANTFQHVNVARTLRFTQIFAKFWHRKMNLAPYGLVWLPK